MNILVRSLILVICLYVLSLNILHAKKRVNTKAGMGPFQEVTAEEIPSEWKDLVNPKTKKFWEEGNHLPDEGFLLFAQNPTSIEYAKLWLLRMETKANILNKMQKTIDTAQREMIKDGLMEDRYWQFEDLKEGKISKRLTKSRLGKLNYYFIFNSSCPHCSGLAKKLKNFPNIRPLQVDNTKLKHFEGLGKTTMASRETIKSYAPDGIVPVLVIHNAKKNMITKIIGNRPIDEIYMAANSLLSAREK